MYFSILVTVSCINCLVSLATAWLLLCRVFAPAPKPAPDTRSTPVAVVVPCYLPNEQGIIMGTIAHILRRVDYPAPLTLYIVYNSPTDLPAIEARLAAFEPIHLP